MEQMLGVLCALADLTPRQREVFVDRALCGMTQVEIAIRDGVTKSAVYLLERKATEKARRAALRLGFSVS